MTSPPAILSSVDLPEPERPSNPRISPSCNARSISASTCSGSPDGFVNDLHMARISSTTATSSEGGAAALATFPSVHSLRFGTWGSR
ncbi:conserved hypothetical protein [Burkholderia cenocepacia]|nr:conserved hypothetical protein [Burkholderia cenocepacia]